MCALTAILAWRAAAKSQAAHSLLAFATIARPGRHALIAAATLCITLGTYFGLNYAKFRTFGGVPLQYYDFYTEFPLRMRLAGGKQIHLENIPTGLATYFGLHGTPEPSAIGQTESHGCIHLTNWDATKLARLVSPGTKVVLQ